MTGPVLPVLLSLSWIPLEESGQGICLVATDVSDQKRAEEMAEETARIASLYTRSLIEASLDPLVTISREGKITDVNQATEKVTGVARERLIGSDFCSISPSRKKRGRVTSRCLPKARCAIIRWPFDTPPVV